MKYQTKYIPQKILLTVVILFLGLIFVPGALAMFPDFTSNVTSGPELLTVQFNALDTVSEVLPPGTTLTAVDWGWDFGNGDTLLNMLNVTPNPVESYCFQPKNTGLTDQIYPVTLSATVEYIDKDGYHNVPGYSTTKYITVQSTCPHILKVSPEKGFPGQIISVYGTNLDKVTRLMVDSLDLIIGQSGQASILSQNATQIDAIIPMLNPFQYYKVWADCGIPTCYAPCYTRLYTIVPGCHNISCAGMGTFEVEQTGPVDFTSNVTTGRAPLTVQFNGTSVFDTSGTSPMNWTDWGWEFDSDFFPLISDSSRLQNPVYTFTNPGNYSITLGVWEETNGILLQNSTTKFDYINVSPVLIIAKSATTNNPTDSSTYNAVGQIITYTYTVTNPGTKDISGPITIADNKITSGPITISPTGLSPGDNVTGPTPPDTPANYTITQDDLNKGLVTNSATATAQTTDDTSVTSNIATATITKAQIIPILTWNPIGSVPYGTLLTIPTATDQNNNPIAG